MTPNEHAPDELCTLTDELLNGSISDEDIVALEEMLRRNTAAQRFFLDYCQLHVELAVDAHADHALEAFCQFRDGRSKPTEKRAATGLLGSVIHQIGQHLPGPGAMGVVLGALALVAAAVLLRSAAPLAPDVEPPDQAPAAAPAAPQQFAAGTKFRVARGESSIALRDGVSVVITGPAELELVGPLRARLVRGRIKVRITDARIERFVVETPNGEVVDLGTEFGLDVSDDGKTQLVVFQGAVDLHVARLPEDQGAPLVERLVEGEGVVVNKRGQLRRVMSIVTGEAATYAQPTDARTDDEPVIVDVRDNLRTSETKNFYEIVPGGLKEDALAYVDRRSHDWNGVDENGMPAYLVGADYIKTFNNDRTEEDFAIQVTLARPARLFVLFDKRLPVPDWLKKDFRDTGDVIGLDMGPFRQPKTRRWYNAKRDIGPGKFDNTLGVWEQVVTAPGQVTLGSAEAASYQRTTMYGIAAVALK